MINLARLREGRPVYDADRRLLGRVQRVDGSGFFVQGRHIDLSAVRRIESNGVFLRTAGEGASVAGAAGPLSVAGAAGPPATTRTERAAAVRSHQTAPDPDAPTEAIPALAAPGTAPEPARDPAPLPGAPPETAEWRVPVVEERVHVETRPITLGEVRIHKTVTEEQQAVAVDVTRETVSVEVVRVEPRPATELERAQGFRAGTIQVPVWGEEPAVQRQAIVTGEVVIHKERVVEHQDIPVTVRKLRVEVEDSRDAGRAEGALSGGMTPP